MRAWRAAGSLCGIRAATFLRGERVMCAPRNAKEVETWRAMHFFLDFHREQPYI
jgi:hypothetical protein